MIKRQTARLTLAAAMALATVGSAGSAIASCLDTKVLEVFQTCFNDACAGEGQVAYQARIKNISKKNLFLTYKFSRPDGAWIKGGFEVAPGAETVHPIGLGPIPFPEESDNFKRARLDVVECGTDSKIKYKWR